MRWENKETETTMVVFILIVVIIIEQDNWTILFLKAHYCGVGTVDLYEGTGLVSYFIGPTLFWKT